MLLCEALVETVVSEKCIATIIRVERIGKLGTLAVTSNRGMLRTNTCHREDGRDTLFRNIGSCNSHTALTPRRRHS
jgi:hypothetical protein